MSRYLAEDGLAYLWGRISNLNDWAKSESNGAAHNALYRGKDITENVLNGYFFESIEDGSFNEIFVGDYFILNSKGISCTISGSSVSVSTTAATDIKFYVSHLDKFWHIGDNQSSQSTSTVGLNKHHVCIIPDSAMGTGPMHYTNATSSGYKTCSMNNSILATVKQNIVDAGIDSSHFIQRREYISNASSSGSASAGEFIDSSISIMCEQEIFGSTITHNTNNFDTGIDFVQHALFRHDPSRIASVRQNWWMRDIASSTNYAIVSGYVSCGSLAANNTSTYVIPMIING